MLTFTLNSTDSISPIVSRLVREAPQRVNELTNVMGRKTTGVLKDYYRQVNASYEGRGRKLLGGQAPDRRTQFWAAVARSVSNPRPDGPGRAVVTVGHPAIMQKLRGGTIRPKEKKALTIPVHPAAYGRRASVLEKAEGIKLFAMTAKSGVGLLAAKADDGKIVVYYLLKKSVDQSPDPQALPDLNVLKSAVNETAGNWLVRWASGRLG